MIACQDPVTCKCLSKVLKKFRSWRLHFLFKQFKHAGVVTSFWMGGDLLPCICLPVKDSSLSSQVIICGGSTSTSHHQNNLFHFFSTKLSFTLYIGAHLHERARRPQREEEVGYTVRWEDPLNGSTFVGEAMCGCGFKVVFWCVVVCTVAICFLKSRHL